MQQADFASKLISCLSVYVEPSTLARAQQNRERLMNSVRVEDKVDSSKKLSSDIRNLMQSGGDIPEFRNSMLFVELSTEYKWIQRDLRAASRLYAMHLEHARD